MITRLHNNTASNRPCFFLASRLAALLALCIATIIFTPNPAPAQSSQNEPLHISAAVQQAQALIARGQPSEAIRVIDGLGNTSAGYYRPLLVRCMALNVLGRYNEALADADAAAAIEPNDKNVLYGRAVALVQLGRADQAAPSLDKIIAADPRFSPGYFYRGITNKSSGRNNEAIEDFQRAIQYASTADEWLKPHAKQYLAELGVSSGEKTEILFSAQADDGQDSRPEAAPLVALPPASMIGKNLPDPGTVPVTISAPALSGDTQPIFSRRGPRSQPTPGGAPATLPPSGIAPKTLPTDSSDKSGYSAELARLYKTGDIDSTVEFVRGYILQNPREPLPYLDLAAMLLNQGKTGEALGLYEQAAALDPTNPELLTAWGLCLEDADESDQGIEKYKLAIQISPEFPPARLNLGFAYIDTQEFSLAADTFREAIAAQPKYMLHYYGLLTALIGLDDMHAAADVLEKHFGADPIDLGQLPKTNDVFYSLITLVLADPTAAYNTARMLADYNRTDDAATLFHLFVQTYPGRFPEAEQNALEFLAQHPAP